MRVKRQAHLLLKVPKEDGSFGEMRNLFATELLDALNRLVATLPPGVQVEPRLQDDSRGGMGGTALVLSWEEDLP